MKKSQSGFAHLGIIIVLVVVAVISVSGWLVYTSNKLDDSEPSIVQGDFPTKKLPVEDAVTDTAVTPVDTRVTFGELGISMSLKSGWASVKSSDTFGMSYLVTNPASPIAIKAFVSESPAGFEGCMDDSEIQSFVVSLNEPTGVAGVAVYGDNLSGIAAVSSSTKYGMAIKSLKASEMMLSEIKLGSTYFVCQSAHPPLSWSVNFDGKSSNQDGIYAYNTVTPNVVVSADTAGYRDAVEMLKSIKR